MVLIKSARHKSRVQKMTVRLASETALNGKQQFVYTITIISKQQVKKTKDYSPIC
jgi:uncharacterized protein YeaC (DUF1315 family)